MSLKPIIKVFDGEEWSKTVLLCDICGEPIVDSWNGQYLTVKHKGDQWDFHIECTLDKPMPEIIRIIGR